MQVVDIRKPFNQIREDIQTLGDLIEKSKRCVVVTGNTIINKCFGLFVNQINLRVNVGIELCHVFIADADLFFLYISFIYCCNMQVLVYQYLVEFP